VSTGTRTPDRTREPNEPTREPLMSLLGAPGNRDRRRPPLLALIVLTACGPGAEPSTPEQGRTWLAGDHHIHSRYSVGYADSTTPPTPIVGGGVEYPIPMNAVMARRFGLAWMVATDHGGPNHSRVNLELAYPELLLSREAVPEVIQFYGMELDTPGADHSSLIVPHSHDEAERLYDLESGFAKLEDYPVDPARDTEARMLEALTYMRDLPDPPVVIANHPSRSASGPGEYGLDTPAELRGWNDAAPEVAVGMAGAPGHQAGALDRDGVANRRRPQGGYGNYPTLGGFDQMTARLGGFWDSMLGEGRRWWITANSDSHLNWREGGSDFWPGEFSKTYVLARKSHEDILEGVRSGRVFVTTGDLVSELYVTAYDADGTGSASIGGSLRITEGGNVRVTIRFLDPEGPNHRGDNPQVSRVDLIVGQVTGPGADPTADSNPTARVVARFGPEDWAREDSYWTVSYVLEGLSGDAYLRVRGTSSDALEPEPDARREDPWTDLWFYSNPIFLETRL
jgi:hypothetical protein